MAQGSMSSMWNAAPSVAVRFTTSIMLLPSAFR